VPSVLVVGAGAIGAFYGGVLARAGCELSVVARSDYDVVARDGYRIDSDLGDLSFKPRRVRHHSPFTRLVLGRYPQGASPAAEHFAGLVKRGGSSAQVTHDIVGARWKKSAWNTVFNPLSALGGGLGTRDILSSATNIAFVREAMAVVCAIAAAAAHSLPVESLHHLLQKLERKLESGN